MFKFNFNTDLSRLFGGISSIILLMLIMVCFSNISPTYSLEKDSANVCSKLTSVRVLDVYPSNWTDFWDCVSYFPEITCDRIRSREVDIESVYFVREELRCCPGWVVSDDEMECNERCPIGYFGENCQYQCRCFNSPTPETCDVTDGSCNCSLGWTGRECDQSCGPGRYGSNCSLQSIFTCQNGGINDPETGRCLCLSSYIGPECSNELMMGETSSIDCESCFSESCNLSAERCLCGDGFGGRYCNELCNVGKCGQLCTDDCCSGNGRRFINSECLCQDGYIGSECEAKCDVGTYGRNCKMKCPCHGACHHATGVCATCPNGFKGDTCTERCSSLQWGESCNNTCTCKSDQACDVFTGECPTSLGASSPVLVVVIVLVVVGILAIACVCVYRLLKSRKRKIQNDINQAAVTADDSYDTLGAARGETAQYDGLTVANFDQSSYSRVIYSTTDDSNYITIDETSNPPK